MGGSKNDFSVFWKLNSSGKLQFWYPKCVNDLRDLSDVQLSKFYYNDTVVVHLPNIKNCDCQSKWLR